MVDICFDCFVLNKKICFSLVYIGAFAGVVNFFCRHHCTTCDIILHIAMIPK